MHKNNGFIMLKESANAYMPKLAKECPAAIGVIHTFFRYMNKQDNTIAIPMKILEEETGYKRNAVSKALKHLSDIKWIRIYKMGSSNVYAINSEVAWKNNREFEPRAKFRTSIVLTAKEQTENIKPRGLVNLSELREMYSNYGEE